jgi:hypothetical protein
MPFCVVDEKDDVEEAEAGNGTNNETVGDRGDEVDELLVRISAVSDSAGNGGGKWRMPFCRGGTEGISPLPASSPLLLEDGSFTASGDPDFSWTEPLDRFDLG